VSKKIARKNETGKTWVRALNDAWGAWYLGARRADPKDTAASKVADVLLALTSLHRGGGPTLDELAAVARKYLRAHDLSPKDMDRIATIEWIEEALSEFDGTDPVTLSWAIVAKLKLCGEYGDPQPFDGGDVRIQRVLVEAYSSPDASFDTEGFVLRVLEAYGVPRSKARNAFAYRTARVTRDLSRPC
jgi:hypothetical protein